MISDPAVIPGEKATTELPSLEYTGLPLVKQVGTAKDLRFTVRLHYSTSSVPIENLSMIAMIDSIGTVILSTKVLVCLQYSQRYSCVI